MSAGVITPRGWSQDEIAEHFDRAPGISYLDTATYGLPPRRTLEAVAGALDSWRLGSAHHRHDWDAAGERSRELAARLIGCPSRELALIPTVAAGVGMVAASLTAADEVVVPEDEFGSVILPLAVAAERTGARLVKVPFGRLEEAIGTRTTWVAASMVRSNGGGRLRLDPVAAAARSVGAELLIDVTHACGILPVDAAARGIGVVVVHGYKHLLCPRGAGFMRVAGHLWTRIVPILASGASTHPERIYGPGPADLAGDARRFDLSLAWHSWVGAERSLEFLLSVAPEARERWCTGLATRFATEIGVEPTGSSVVSVPTDLDETTLQERLRARGVAAAVRAGGARFSFHLYNTEEDVERGVEAMRAL